MEDKPINQNPPQKQNTAKMLIGELGIIISLTIILIVGLNFLHVLDLKTLFSTNSVSSKNRFTSNTNPVLSLAQNDLSQPDLAALVTSKSLKYVRAVSEFEAKIESIDTKPGVDATFKTPYVVKLNLILDDNSKMAVSYPKQALDKIRIKDASKKRINFSDLKPGNKINIVTTTGLQQKYPNNFFDVLILVK